MYTAQVKPHRASNKMRETILTQRVSMSTTLVHHASQNLTDTLRDDFLHDVNTTALVIYDLNSPLSMVLIDPYQAIEDIMSYYFLGEASVLM